MEMLTKTSSYRVQDIMRHYGFGEYKVSEGRRRKVSGVQVLPLLSACIKPFQQSVRNEQDIFQQVGTHQNNGKKIAFICDSLLP